MPSMLHQGIPVALHDHPPQNTQVVISLETQSTSPPTLTPP